MKKVKDLSRMEPEPDPDQLISEAITSYFDKYSIPGKKLIRPGVKASSIDKNHVYLKTGKHLLAIYNIRSKKFLPLTTELIIKHSK